MAVIIDGLMHQRMNFPVLATKKDQAQDRIDDIRTLLESSPLGFEEIVDTDNKGEIILNNGTSYKAFTANPDNARGISARTIFVDEMAFIEDQSEVMDAFMPTISLGEDGKMLQISTPRVSNDDFMETNRRGRNGADDVIAIKQPTFKNADDIDINRPLTEQEAVPVRPDMNAGAFESQRRSDPQGFAQEYLCRPISDEYRFFDEDSIKRAQERGDPDNDEYEYGAFTGAQNGGLMVGGIDLGATGDDTVITVFEHVKKKRYLRYHEVVSNKTLELSGIPNPDRANPNHLLKRFADLKQQMGIDHFVIDATGMGKFFDSNITDILGRGVHKFDFNNKEDFLDMAGDLNAALREDMVTLTPDRDMFDQLCAMVKDQSEDYQTPKLSGKDYSKNGKDDIAVSLILGAYPIMLNSQRSQRMHEADNDDYDLEGEGAPQSDKVPSTPGTAARRGNRVTESNLARSGGSFSSRNIANSGKRSYTRRHGGR